MHLGALRTAVKLHFRIEFVHYPHPNFIYQLLVRVIIVEIWSGSSSFRCMVAMSRHVVNFALEHHKHAAGQSFDDN